MEKRKTFCKGLVKKSDRNGSPLSTFGTNFEFLRFGSKQPNRQVQKNSLGPDIDQIRVDITVSELVNLFIPHTVRPLLQNPFLRIHESLRQSLCRFVVNKICISVY